MPSILKREAPPRDPCEGCSAPAECDVWGARLCYGCHGAWIQDDRFSTGAINGFLGVPNTVEQFTKEAHAKYCAEATKRTRAWLSERKTARAA